MEDKKQLESFDELKGHILGAVDTGDEEVVFTLEDGSQYKLYHQQDCCESVTLAEVVGDVEDLLGSPLLMADENSNHADEAGDYESVTWTFYKMATVKGYVTLRWCGSSNGYYSESVDWALANA